MSRGSDLWSRRKARVAEEAAAEATQREVAAVQAERLALEDRPDHEVLAELGLPEPDTLGAGDDFRAFMVRTVPERLRRRALRKLWTSNPVLACVDGLNDYDDDYTSAAVCGADMKTAYEVGRGIVRRIADPLPVDTPSEAPETAQPVCAEADKVVVASNGNTPPDAPETKRDVAHAAPAPRRMRFAFAASEGGSPA